MSKKPARRRAFYGISADAIPLGPLETTIEAIENASDGTASNDRFRARIEQLMARDYYDPDGDDDAAHLRETRGGRALEEKARWAGFVLGFEFHEWLQAGGVKTKGGA